MLKALFKNLLSKKTGSEGETPSTPAPDQLSPEQSANRFVIATNRVRHHQFYRALVGTRHPYGIFLNRPIIGEHTGINGGVYLSAAPAEALVVEESYGMLRPIAASFRSRFKGAYLSSIEFELTILEEIFNLANKALDFDPERVLELNKAHGFSPDQKVALDVYLTERIGVARHRVILAAYIIEKLREDGKLTGLASITPNISRDDCDDERLIYTFRNGALATYDPRPSAYDKAA